MRLNSRLVAFFLIVVIWMPADASARPLTLRLATELALQNNEQIRQFRERVSQKQYDDRAAWGNFLPNLSLQGSYTHLNEPLQIDLDPIRQAMIQIQGGNQVEFTNIYGLLGGSASLTPDQRSELFGQYSRQLDAVIPPFVETLKDQDYPTATLVAMQPIFTGGKLRAAKKAAAAEWRAAEAELIQTEHRIVGEVITNYLAVVFLTEVIQTRREVLAGMERHRTDARRLFDEGLIARYQVLRAEVAVADAERNLFDDQNRLELVVVALQHILGFSDNDTPEIFDSLTFRTVAGALEDYCEAAVEGQPILTMIEEKKKAAGQKYAVERADFLPQVAGFGKYELFADDLSALEPRWVIGLQLKLNLFSGLKRYHRVQSARHLKAEVEHLEAHTRRQIDLLVQKTYREVRNAEQRYQKLQADIALAKENLYLNERRFQTGLGRSLDVIDAQLSLEKNTVERLQSLYDYYVSLTNLHVAVGQPEHMLTLWESRNE